MLKIGYELDKIQDIDISILLETINERITVLLDREHQIGHTYLMKVKTIDDLSAAFQLRIFPLLQEYFFNDWEKIAFILGNNGFISKKRVNELEFDTYGDDRFIYARLSDDDQAWNDAEQYRKIYQQNHPEESEEK